MGAWTCFFVVFRNSLLTAKAVGINPLERHIKKFHGYVKKCGTKVWHLLYQADVRMRLEEMPSVRCDAVSSSRRPRR